MDENKNELDTKEIRIALDLAHFGELVAAVVKRYSDVAGVEAPADDEWREIMRHAWDYCLMMADRVQMARTSLDDLDALPVYEPSAEIPPNPRPIPPPPSETIDFAAYDEERERQIREASEGTAPGPFDRPLDTRRLSDKERAARRPRE